MKKRTAAPEALLLLLLLLTPSLRMEAQAAEEGSLDWYQSRAREAASSSNYETAVKLLSEAKARYPSSPKPNTELGDLYYDKELYTLSLDEYRAAEKKGKDDFHVLTQISRCYGKLNREKTSIEYLERILSLFPDSLETMDDLGWMYFKTNQLSKGEKILLEGIKKFGMQRSMAMTLGTIYSGMNRYERSREYYLKSIDEALKENDRYFASIAYYNLSLLENNFFRYNSSLSCTEDSISMEDRASGHLARGELLMSRMDYPGALAEYQKAFERDTTPLARVNMAILHQRFGHLELARRYAEEALGAKDLAWLLYYGTDVSRHYKDIHEILADVYLGLSRVEATRPTAGFFDRISALFASLRDRIVSWYHRQRFRLYSLAIGRGYLAEGRLEEAFGEFYDASEAYGEVAADYLAKANALETARMPHASWFYILEEGKLTHSRELLLKSIEGFDPFWEKEAVADALASAIPLLDPPDAAPARRDALNRLFDINPGAFRQNGFGLPLLLEVPRNLWGGREKAMIVRYLKRTGSEVRETDGETDGRHSAPEGFRFLLRLTLEAEGNARYTASDPRTGRILAESAKTLSGRPRERCAALVRDIIEDLYRVQ